MWTIVLWLALSAGAATRAAESVAMFRTEGGTFGVDSTGTLRLSTPLGGGRELLAAQQPAPVLSVRVEERVHRPSSATWDEKSSELRLRFEDVGVTARVEVQSKGSHVVFGLAAVEPSNRVEVVIWGPYPTVIGDIIGETVGVVRDGQCAVGLQALNPKTIGGYPTQESDIEAEYGADDPGRYAEFPASLTKEQLFRGDAARRTEFGSVLQAYCRNRDRARVVANWGHEKFEALPFVDGGVVGSRIALFACAAADALATIGRIEIAENLPHPMLGGVWAKQARGATASYLIVDFGEATLDRAVAMTRRAGLSYLYQSSPFETWGHFRLKPGLFPNGWAGMRRCVERARLEGVEIGFHTLSNFITPNDPYVTPVPDPRLARIGSSALALDVDARQAEVCVDAPDYFRKKTAMNAVRIGDELVRYAAVSEEAPWRLLDCQRGAWGTEAVAHRAGTAVARLMDHDYKVFLTDAALGQEVARTIARFCNETGARQLSFDGLEGNWSTGMGQYGRTLFTTSWYEALDRENRGRIINDASNPGHFNWHIYTRMNWGEPWYAGFRESQTLYRFKNQVYYERNLMPRMLGWFALRPDTSLEDAEWLLARAAGFNSGFALAASLASTAQLEADPSSADAARQFGALPAILEAVKQWETARMADAFPPDVRDRMRDNAREFHLEPVSPSRWTLFEVYIQRAAQEGASSSAAELEFNNPYGDQRLQWTVRNVGKQPASGLFVQVDRKKVVDLLNETIPAGGSLRYTGANEATVCDSAWRELARVQVDVQAAVVANGRQKIVFGCRPSPEASLRMEARTLGPGRSVEARQAETGANR